MGHESPLKMNYSNEDLYVLSVAQLCTETEKTIEIVD